jgi:hypothetical protein
MLKRVAVLALLAPLTLGNLSRPVEAAGWAPFAALLLAGHLSSPPDTGWRHSGGFRRAPYYPRYYDGGFYRAPYYPRYSGAYSGGYDAWCGGYGNYGGYGGYANYGGYGGYGGYGRYGGDDGYANYGGYGRYGGYDGNGW